MSFMIHLIAECTIANIYSYSKKIKFAILGHFRDGGNSSVSYLSLQETLQVFWGILQILILEININIMNGKPFIIIHIIMTWQFKQPIKKKFLRSHRTLGTWNEWTFMIIFVSLKICFIELILIIVWYWSIIWNMRLHCQCNSHLWRKWENWIHWHIPKRFFLEAIQPQKNGLCL